MRQNVYSIRDRCSKLYDRPWVAHSDAAAVRSFTDIATDEEHPIGRHPEDFTLFRIGTWDEQEGVLKGEAAEKVVNGAEVQTAEVIEFQSEENS